MTGSCACRSKPKHRGGSGKCKAGGCGRGRQHTSGGLTYGHTTHNFHKQPTAGLLQGFAEVGASEDGQNRSRQISPTLPKGITLSGSLEIHMFACQKNTDPTGSKLSRLRRSAKDWKVANKSGALGMGTRLARNGIAWLGCDMVWQTTERA